MRKVITNEVRRKGVKEERCKIVRSRQSIVIYVASYRRSISQTSYQSLKAHGYGAVDARVPSAFNRRQQIVGLYNTMQGLLEILAKRATSSLLYCASDEGMMKMSTLDTPSSGLFLLGPPTPVRS